MKIISSILLLFILLAFTLNNISAENRSQYIRSNNYSPPYFFTPSSSEREFPIKFRTQIVMPGLGNLKINLTHVRSIESITLNSKGQFATQAVVALYRGIITSKAGSFPVAAEAGLKKSEKYLNLNFVPLENPERFIQIQLNLDRQQAFWNRKRNLQKFNCGTTEHPQTRKLELAKSTPRDTSASNQIIDLSLDADSAWQTIFGSNANNKMLSLINATEVIYARELGLVFNIKRANVYSDLSFGSSNPSSKLDAFINFTQNQTYFKKSDIYYLFTGESLLGGAVGFGSVGTVCASYYTPAALSMYNNDQITPLVIAHEIGHVMGASHDFEDNCGNEKAIMNPVLSPPYPSTFSSCSKTSFANQLERYGNCFDQIKAPEIPQVVSITGSLAKTGRFKMNINLNEELTDCMVDIKASKSKAKLKSANSIASFPISIGSLLIEKKLVVSTNDLTAKGQAVPIYLQADLTCQDKSATTNIIKFFPTKVISSKKVSIKKWIKLLSQKLNSF